MKTYFLTTFFILTSLTFIACNSNKESDSSDSNTIIKKLKDYLKEEEAILQKHADQNWIEPENQYGLSDHIDKNKLFDVIQYAADNQTSIAYSTHDAMSLNARREIYLAFEYDSHNIKSVFKQFANKIARHIKQIEISTTSNDIEKLNTRIIKSQLSLLLEYIRKYAKNYYIEIFGTLNDKKDKLNQLNLNDLRELEAKFVTVRSAKAKIKQEAEVIKNEFDNNIEINSTSKHRLRSNANANEIASYLQNKQSKFENNAQKIEDTVADIKKILNRIK
ncbi:hypothetical protein baBA2_000920 (plasmid) [Borrelia anserina]|uniref:Lipoprotein n=1 Tax=Borrelia anserina Es TaxID=1365188 RepID=A0ABN4UAB9_BORAN|nr:virulence associated lipoprotein [Borrelia anserina]APR65326.1 hypothetical protein N187_A07 [Borrelia anserina Es]UPA07294.1 hypothetical protein baBA2_000920 [Borrelia anserina]